MVDRDSPEFISYYIRVLMREARSRRGSSFHATLLKWIADARRRLVAAKAAHAATSKPAQGDLFGGWQ